MLLLCLAASAPAGAQDEQQLQQNQQELARVRSRIEAVQSKLEKDRGRQDELQEQLEDTEKKIAETHKLLRSLDIQIREQQKKVSATQDEKTGAQRLLDSQRLALGQQIRAAYLIGERGQIKLLLNQEDTHKLGRVLVYYDFLNRARAQRIRSITAQVEYLHAIEGKLRAQLIELTGLKERQQQTLGDLESKRYERARMVKKLEQRIAGEAGELKQLRANEKGIQALLKSLRDALADIPMNLGEAKPFARMKGKLRRPVRGQLLANFGDAKAGGKLSWNGLWIAAEAGAPVRAVARGRVAYVGWMHRYGLIVILEHDGGYFSLYGHAERVTRSEGEWVNPGEVIANAGNTGGHDQNGVYFEIRRGSEPLDPNDWLAH